MPELSKTAKAAQKAVEAGQAKKPKEQRSTEKVIADIRNNREAHLACSFTDVDVLLAEYDKLVAEAATRQTTLDSFVAGTAQDDEKDRSIRKAVEALYYSAVWHADRPVDEVTLWEAVRDAFGFEPGKAPVEIPAPAPAAVGQQEHQVIIDEITS